MIGLAHMRTEAVFIEQRNDVGGGNIVLPETLEALAVPVFDPGHHVHSGKISQPRQIALAVGLSVHWFRQSHANFSQ